MEDWKFDFTWFDLILLVYPSYQIEGKGDFDLSSQQYFQNKVYNIHDLYILLIIKM